MTAIVYCDPSSLSNHPATTFYCANGGTCSVAQQDATGIQYACQCTSEFAGTHCEFVQTTAPTTAPVAASVKDESITLTVHTTHHGANLSDPPARRHGGAAAGLALGAVAVVVVFFYGVLVWKRKRHVSIAVTKTRALHFTESMLVVDFISEDTNSTTTTLQLDPDGSTTFVENQKQSEDDDDNDDEYETNNQVDQSARHRMSLAVTNDEDDFIVQEAYDDDESSSHRTNDNHNVCAESSMLPEII